MTNLRTTLVIEVPILFVANEPPKEIPLCNDPLTLFPFLSLTSSTRYWTEERHQELSRYLWKPQPPFHLEQTATVPGSIN